jgi:outer membrane lipoprotein-sorting protein
MCRSGVLRLAAFVLVIATCPPLVTDAQAEEFTKPVKTSKASHLTFDEIRAGVTSLYNNIWALEVEYIQLTDNRNKNNTSISKMRYHFAFKGEKRMKFQYIGDATEADFTVAFDEARSQHYMANPSRGRISNKKDRFSDVDAYAYALGLALRDAERAATVRTYDLPAALQYKGAEWFVEPRLETVDGAECHVLRSNRTSQRIWVDPAIGFAVRFREIRQPVEGMSPDQYPLMTVIKFGSFLEAAPHTWLPKRISSIDFVRVRAPREQWNQVSYTCEFDVSTLKVGRQVEDEMFNLKFPKGTTVLDGVRDRTYRIGDAGEELEVAVREGQAALATNPKSNRLFYLFGINVLVILGGLVLFVRYRRKPRSG